MSYSAVHARFNRKVDHSDGKQRKDRVALHSLIKGGSIEQAAAKAGYCVKTLYNRGIVDRYVEHLATKEAKAMSS
jgi:hypothetical protein